MSRPGLDRSKSKFVLSDATDDIHAHYVLGRQLGQPGQFGYALMATHKRTGEKRAVKVMSKCKFSRATDRKIHFDELRTEIEVMKRMNHVNIIKMYDVFETQSELFIVMELCVGGELFDRIKAQPDGSYSERDAVGILKQIAEGIRYLHQHGIVHCDLKPDNFLFSDDRKDSSVKVIDFGMSKFVKRAKYFRSLRGTPYYIAPEVIQGHYKEACDMWSFGVVMFVMLFGYPPFHGEKDQDIFNSVLKGFSPTTKRGYGAWFPAEIPCSDSAKDLIGKLLTLDTAKRYTAEEVLEHPFMTGAASSAPMGQMVMKNLKSFTSNSKLKQGVLHLMTSTLSDDELNLLKKIFMEIDENGDGQITVNELAKAIERSGDRPRFDELRELMKAADADGNGTLSYNELVLSCVQRKLSQNEERLWNAFRKLDLNGDGKVSAQEIEKVLGAQREDVKKMIAEIDANGDGEIDFDEFLDMWSHDNSLVQL